MPPKTQQQHRITQKVDLLLKQKLTQIQDDMASLASEMEACAGQMIHGENPIGSIPSSWVWGEKHGIIVLSIKAEYIRPNDDHYEEVEKEVRNAQ